nr:helix-turn-helix transcriptional regulator [Chromobacterium sp. ASV5]
MRDTQRKRAILRMLEQHDKSDYLEIGPPPWDATTIAEQIGGSVQSVARTLRAMAKAGVLVSVEHRTEVWNAIAQGFTERRVTAYYSARTMEHDMAAAKLWRDTAEDRSREAVAGMLAAFAGVSRAGHGEQTINHLPDDFACPKP